LDLLAGALLVMWRSDVGLNKKAARFYDIVLNFASLGLQGYLSLSCSGLVWLLVSI
jgi:hypothetical protein